MKEKKFSYLLQPKQKSCLSVYTVIYNADGSAKGSVCEDEVSCAPESEIPSQLV